MGRTHIREESSPAHALTAHIAKGGDPTTDNYVVTGGFFDQPTHSLSADGFDASEDGTGRGTPLASVAFSSEDYGADADDIAPTLRAMGHDGSHANGGGQVAVAFNLRGRDGGSQPEMCEAASLRSASGGRSRSYVAQYAVRRLTPRECERLQGLPDGWTAVTYRGKPAADGPRYKAIGNGMAAPVLRWIGERIAMVDAL